MVKLSLPKMPHPSDIPPGPFWAWAFFNIVAAVLITIRPVAYSFLPLFAVSMGSVILSAWRGSHWAARPWSLALYVAACTAFILFILILSLSHPPQPPYPVMPLWAVVVLDLSLVSYLAFETLRFLRRNSNQAS